MSRAEPQVCVPTGPRIVSPLSEIVDRLEGVAQGLGILHEGLLSLQERLA